MILEIRAWNEPMMNADHGNKAIRRPTRKGGKSIVIYVFLNFLAFKKGKQIFRFWIKLFLFGFP
jgi:hypothetical protein